MFFFINNLNIFTNHTNYTRSFFPQFNYTKNEDTMLMLNVKSKIFGIVQACTVFHNPLQYSISTRFPNTVSPDIQIRRLLIVVSRLNRFHFCCSSNHNNNIISKTICSVLYWAHSVLNSHNQNKYFFYVRAHSHCVWSPFHLYFGPLQYFFSNCAF